MGGGGGGDGVRLRRPIIAVQSKNQVQVKSNCSWAGVDLTLKQSPHQGPLSFWSLAPCHTGEVIAPERHQLGTAFLKLPTPTNIAWRGMVALAQAVCNRQLTIIVHRIVLF